MRRLEVYVELAHKVFCGVASVCDGNCGAVYSLIFESSSHFSNRMRLFGRISIWNGEEKSFSDFPSNWHSIISAVDLWHVPAAFHSLEWDYDRVCQLRIFLHLMLILLEYILWLPSNTHAIGTISD